MHTCMNVSLYTLCTSMYVDVSMLNKYNDDDDDHAERTLIIHNHMIRSLPPSFTASFGETCAILLPLLVHPRP